MVDSATKCLLDYLDIELAERIVGRRLADGRLHALREARDLAWILGALGGRGIHVTQWDVADCLGLSAGRFRPGQKEFFLIHGLRRAIDHIDELADAGKSLSPESCRGIYKRLTRGIEGHGGMLLRQTMLKETIPGRANVPLESLPELFECLSEERGFMQNPTEFQRFHPVEQAARIFQRVSMLAPFPDFNLLVASLSSSLHLLRHGYPPFLPRGSDTETLARSLRWNADRHARLYSGIVLRGFKEFSVAN